MIQRVQSLFLAGVVVLLAVSMFFPVWQKLDSGNESGAVLRVTHTEILTPGQEKQLQYFPTAALGILLVIGIVIAAAEIIQYRNRLNQMKLGAFNSLIIAGFLGLSVYFSFRMEKMVAVVEEGNYDFGMYLPAAALICNLLANRFIRKDEALVRSVDRIR